LKGPEKRFRPISDNSGRPPNLLNPVSGQLPSGRLPGHNVFAAGKAFLGPFTTVSYLKWLA